MKIGAIIVVVVVIHRFATSSPTRITTPPILATAANSEIYSTGNDVHPTVSGIRPTAGRLHSIRDEIHPTDNEPGSPMSAPSALKSMTLPEGFTATVFAAEPLVRQPIDMKVDARGRVGVAEAYWYPNQSGSRQDRITVLEDSDGDGVADKQTIFAAGLDRLTSIEIGFGGVWVLAPPMLTFYPDADADLVPDSPPSIRISNWNTHAQWNLANGLTFGPDGWLYGRQGQMGTSTPRSSTGSAPGRISGGIWRYRPLDGKLEIVAQGMTNPWGLDWNADGELFASGNCNGHLWHIVGGSLYEWGFGAREFSSEFGRTPPIEMAPHYAPTGDWLTAWKQRDAMADANNAFGGGHSHCGLLICNGSAWPTAMRGHTLMSNIHGQRINEDTLESDGSSYISRRIGDPMLPTDPWFRGVSLVAAPDGAFFLSDWSDTGECHDKDNVNRNSGRIFRILPTPPVQVAAIDTMDDTGLLELLVSDREEPARKSLRTLQHRLRSEKCQPETRPNLVALLAAEDFTTRLRALSVLSGAGVLDNKQVLAASRDSDDRLRAMAVRCWADGASPQASATRFLEMAASDPSPRVALHLASVTRLVSDPLRQQLTVALIDREQNPIDERTARLLWHIRIQDSNRYPGDSAKLIASCKSASFAGFLARDLIESEGSLGMETLFSLAATLKDPVPMISAAVESARRQNAFMPPPKGWPALRDRWNASPDTTVRALALSAAILFGDEDALARLQATLDNPDATVPEKTAALEIIAAARTPESMVSVTRAFRDPALRIPAIRAMRHLDQPLLAASLLSNWPYYSPDECRAVVETLVSRKPWALLLLDAVAAGEIPKSDLSAAQARSLADSGDASLRASVLDHWGDPHRSDDQKQATLDRATRLLTSAPEGDPVKGRETFTRACGICHTLFGEGGKLGPDLTGRNRADLTPLLTSIIDPSAEVPEDGRLTVVTRKDGGILSGILISSNASNLVIRTQQGDISVKAADIASSATPTTSPMPEGLLEPLSDTQLIDLLSYIRSDQK